MLRLCLVILSCPFALPSLVVDSPFPPKQPDATADGPRSGDEVVIVHFGDSTCITSYLPKERRVEAVLNDRLSAFYKHQRIASHNVATGGDFVRRHQESQTKRQTSSHHEMNDFARSSSARGKTSIKESER